MEKGALDVIFDSLSNNSTIETIQLSYFSNLKLNLKNSNSLRFLESNRFLTHLDFRKIVFSNLEMNILDESLKQNETLKELDLSLSNYCGTFEFLQNKLLRIFKFDDIWKNYLTLEDSLLLELSKNSTLKEIEFGKGYTKYETEILLDIGKLIEILSKHESIERLRLTNLKDVVKTDEFWSLLVNHNLKSIDVSKTFSVNSAQNMKKFLETLSQNSTITDVTMTSFEFFFSNEF